MCDIDSMPKNGEVNNDEQITEHNSWLWTTKSNILKALAWSLSYTNKKKLKMYVIHNYTDLCHIKEEHLIRRIRQTGESYFFNSFVFINYKMSVSLF